MSKTPEQKIMELEAKVRLLEKQKAQLEHHHHVADSKAIIFDMMIDLAEKEYNIDIRKKLLTRTVQSFCQKEEESISFTCGLFGLYRQIYYRSVERKKKKQSLAEQVLALVEQQRIIQPKVGTRKLYFMLHKELKALKIGRDKFFNILRTNHLLIVPKRTYHVTTWSHHRFQKHANLIKEMDIIRPEQVWVSDITYIGKREKPCYLSLITDAYSKKIWVMMLLTV